VDRHSHEWDLQKLQRPKFEQLLRERTNQQNERNVVAKQQRNKG